MYDCAHSLSPHSCRYTQTHAADALHLRTAAESNLDRANRTLADANAAAARHESAAQKRQHELDAQRAANEKRAAEAAAERKTAEVCLDN
jgi:multidrug resistance efflux pump